MVIYTTKTTSRISQITAELVAPFARDLSTRYYVFCEDKNTLSLESAIAQKTGGSFNVTVTSFSRYLSQGLSSYKVLSKTGSALTVFRIMSDLSSSLARLKLTNNASISSSIYQLIAQLKSAKVTPMDIEKIVGEERGALSTKLKDINAIYAQYEKVLKEENALDSNSFYSLMPAFIAGDENLKGARVIFAGFSSVTKQIIDIFQAFNGVCHCDFVLLKGNGEFYTNEIYHKVLDVFPSAQTKADTFEFSKEALAIERGLFSSSVYSLKPIDTNKIHVAKCLSPYEEAEKIAKRIRKEVIGGKRYKDFTICASNPKAYEEIFKDRFKDYQIPLYVDGTSTMENHPIIRLIGGLIDVFLSGFNVEQMSTLSFERLIATPKESQAFVNYVKTFAVGRKSVKQPFDLTAEGGELAEKVREKIILLCKNFKKKMTASQFVGAIENILKQGNLIEKCGELCAELSQLNMGEKSAETIAVCKKIDLLLKEISVVVGEREFSLMECKTMFFTGAKSYEISILPMFNDMVFMGDFTSSKQRQAQTLFVVGLNGDVPDARQDTALLTDRDLIKMDGYKCVIEPKIATLNKRERENVGVSLMSFNEKLYLSYAVSDGRGGKCTPSQVIEDFLKIFNVKLTDYDVCLNAGLISERLLTYNYMSWEQAKESFSLFLDGYSQRNNQGLETASSFYQVACQLGKKEEIDRLIEERAENFTKPVVDHFSATTIERYFSCPYKAFVDFNLKLKEDETGEVEVFEFGNMLHTVLELFVKKLSLIDSEESVKEIAGQIFDQLISKPEYSRYLNKPNYPYIFSLVKKEAEKRCKTVYLEFLNSKYKPIGEEVAFGSIPGAKLDGIILKTAYGDKKISGKIDRVDRWEDYLRIIDYKTGNPHKKIEDESLYAGLNLQLYLYANAFLSKDTKLGGAYYYRVEDGYSGSQDEKHTFIGKTLFDEQNVIAMDSCLETEMKNTSLNVSFKGKDEGRYLYKNKSMVTSDQLEAYLTYAKKIAQVGVSELIEGFIEPTPYEDSCKYCKYKGMCGHDEEVDGKVRKVNAYYEVIEKAVKEDDENE